MYPKVVKKINVNFSIFISTMQYHTKKKQVWKNAILIFLAVKHKYVSIYIKTYLGINNGDAYKIAFEELSEIFFRDQLGIEIF